jgi:hypothetical protein
MIGWVGPRAGMDGCGKSLPPPRFDRRTVQPVASRHTDYAIPAQLALRYSSQNELFPNTEAATGYCCVSHVFRRTDRHVCFRYFANFYWVHRTHLHLPDHEPPLPDVLTPNLDSKPQSDARTVVPCSLTTTPSIKPLSSGQYKKMSPPPHLSQTI